MPDKLATALPIDRMPMFSGNQRIFLTGLVRSMGLLDLTVPILDAMSSGSWPLVDFPVVTGRTCDHWLILLKIIMTFLTYLGRLWYQRVQRVGLVMTCLLRSSTCLMSMWRQFAIIWKNIAYHVRSMVGQMKNLLEICSIPLVVRYLERYVICGVASSPMIRLLVLRDYWFGRWGKSENWTQIW